MWTRFIDMHSGGRKKLSHQYILIEAPELEAKKVFYSKFRRNPDRVTCTCCGPDYSISESVDLEQATGYDRGCDYDSAADQYIERSGRGLLSSRDYQTVAEYLASGKALLVHAREITPKDLSADAPEEGYVWK